MLGGLKRFKFVPPVSVIEQELADTLSWYGTGVDIIKNNLGVLFNEILSQKIKELEVVFPLMPALNEIVILLGGGDGAAVAADVFRGIPEGSIGLSLAFAGRMQRSRTIPLQREMFGSWAITAKRTRGGCRPSCANSGEDATPASN